MDIQGTESRCLTSCDEVPPASTTRQERISSAAASIPGFEWGIPLFCKSEQDDSESSEDIVKLSSLEELAADSAPEDESCRITDTSNGQTKESGNSQRIVSDAAVMKEVGLALPVSLRRKKSNKHFYRKMYLDCRKPQHPRMQPLCITINYFAVSAKWRCAIDNAILNIEGCAPGLHFEITQSSSAWIRFLMNRYNECATEGSLRYPLFGEDALNKSVIRVTNSWRSERLPSTAEHELLHALGFEHEHERWDAGHYLAVFEKYKDDEVSADPFVKPLTPFDRHSIMLYRIGRCFELRSERGKEFAENRCMSELDKIALNLVYPPSATESYNPLRADNGMFYCNRRVMDNHNQPERAITEGCGPSSGPNCPACRVLSKPSRLRRHQWQGRSGFVYCGQNRCGPDYGQPCPECHYVVSE